MGADTSLMRNILITLYAAFWQRQRQYVSHEDAHAHLDTASVCLWFKSPDQDQSGSNVGDCSVFFSTSKRSHTQSLSCQVSNFVLQLKCPMIFVAVTLLRHTWKCLKRLSLSFSSCASLCNKWRLHKLSMKASFLSVWSTLQIAAEILEHWL